MFERTTRRYGKPEWGLNDTEVNGIRVPVDVRSLTLDDIAGADEAFFTGTAIEVTPITEVDGRPVGAGKPGPITLRIQQSYFDAVHGRLPRYHTWLAYTRQMQTV